MSSAFFSINDREMKSENGFSLAMASHPFQNYLELRWQNLCQWCCRYFESEVRKHLKIQWQPMTTRLQSIPKLSLKTSWKPMQINNQVCENLSNGSFSEEQKQVQKITANVDMYSDLMKQVLWKYLNTSTLGPGSPHGLCPVPRTMERPGWKKTPHRFSILWQLPHLPWFPGQRLLFRPALCWVSLDWGGGH